MCSRSPPRPDLTAVRRLRQAARGFIKAEQGSTALEFALLGVPMMFLMMALIELGLIFLMQTTLTNATDNISRQIRTGQFQTAGGSAASFKTSICNDLGWMQSSCTSNLAVDVRTYTQFASISLTPPTTNGALDPTKMQFQTGVAGSIVVVRAYYPWTLMVPGVTSALANYGSNQTLLTAVTAFRNEPYT